MLLMGAARLPSLCAAFFMAQKHALYDLLPQPGEACSLYLLERAMNSTCGAARAMSVQDLMQRYFILPTRIDPG
ncbi:hypothetical protein T484DRAFT_1853904 [Baffinella frigidus]|nr:hypothetical protein T484DRAFT_1853904 [Cryptophyta sp. CCMP2293]